MMLAFSELLRKARSNQPGWQPPERLLAIDPGETTGWALFTKGGFTSCGQEVSKDRAAESIQKLFLMVPTVVVVEDYKVYAWKAQEHSWAALFTPKLIGTIEFICFDKKIPIYMQMAQQAKGFCTDDKLKAWGLWQKGQRHSRDAIRHACYWLLFSKQ